MEKLVTINSGKGDLLYGVLHIPEKINRRIGINLLNPGLKSRVAPHRLNVKLARKLCSNGYSVLRFDPTGIGNSEGELSSKNEKTINLWRRIQKGCFVQDTIMGNRVLKLEARSDELIIIGQCGGAVSSALAGSKDEHVTGLVLIDMPCRIIDENMEMTDGIIASYSRRQLVKESITDILRFQWIKKIGDNKKRKNWITSNFKKLKHLMNGKSIIKSEDNENGVNLDLLHSVTSFLENGKEIFFLFAEKDFSRREFYNHFSKLLLNKYSNITVDTIENANHIYAERLSQEKLVNNIINWLNRKYIKRY
jgi:hypothetical protein